MADAYEAMTSDRVYRPALGAEAAREELCRCAGTQFDSVLVEVVRVILPEWVELHRRGLADAGITRLQVVA